MCGDDTAQPLCEDNSSVQTLSCEKWAPRTGSITWVLVRNADSHPHPLAYQTRTCSLMRPRRVAMCILNFEALPSRTA